MSFVLKQNLPLPAESVFPFLNDPDLVMQWMPGLLRFELLSSNPRRPGARFRYHVRQLGRTLVMDGQLLKFDFPSLVSVRLETSQFSIDVRYLLKNLARGCLLEYSLEQARGSALPRILYLPFEKFMRVLALQQLKSLEKCCARAAAVAERSDQGRDI